jgi:hypothetical protein
MYVYGMLCYGWTVWKVRGSQSAFCIRHKDTIFYEKSSGDWRSVEVTEQHLKKLYRVSNYTSPSFQRVKHYLLQTVVCLFNLTSGVSEESHP